MEDGIIEVGSERGAAFGFTQELFDGYLWKDGDRIVVSVIFSRHEGRGNIGKLFSAIESNGFRVAVPTPLGKMTAILMRKGFVPHVERDPMMGDVEVWMRQK